MQSGKRISPFQIICGIVLLGWLAWMIDVQTNYETSRMDGEELAEIGSRSPDHVGEGQTTGEEPVQETYSDYESDHGPAAGTAPMDDTAGFDPSPTD